MTGRKLRRLPDAEPFEVTETALQVVAPQPEPQAQDFPEDVAGYVAAQRARAAYVIARDLPAAALEVRQAVTEANSPRMALAAQQKAVAFGIMLDKLDQLVKPAGLGRYGRKQPADNEPAAYPSLEDFAQSPSSKSANSAGSTR